MNKLYAVGLGPGGEEFFTGQARAAIEKSDIVCGYTVYVDLVKEVYPDKEYFTTAMRQEIDRCRKALELAESGKKLRSTDENYLSLAENMLFEEFAYALDIDKSEVVEYIEKHIA